MLAWYKIWNVLSLNGSENTLKRSRKTLTPPFELTFNNKGFRSRSTEIMQLWSICGWKHEDANLVHMTYSFGWCNRRMWVEHVQIEVLKSQLTAEIDSLKSMKDNLSMVRPRLNALTSRGLSFQLGRIIAWAIPFKETCSLFAGSWKAEIQHQACRATTGKPAAGPPTGKGLFTCFHDPISKVRLNPWKFDIKLYTAKLTSVTFHKLWQTFPPIGEFTDNWRLEMHFQEALEQEMKRQISMKMVEIGCLQVRPLISLVSPIMSMYLQLAVLIIWGWNSMLDLLIRFSWIASICKYHNRISSRG